MGRGRPPSKHENVRVKVQNDIRPIFSCVTPESVSLANYHAQGSGIQNI